MAKTTPEILTKRMAIDKANAQLVIIVAVAAFIAVFCLVASNSVWKQDRYQSRVNSVKTTARNQLTANLSAYSSLQRSYNNFISKPTNIIGGQSNGSGANNGSNAQIVLDALPPSYDFPALTSSIENILSSRGLTVSSITGTDEQLAQQTNNSSTTPTPVAMPFTFTIENLNYTSVGEVISALEDSVRPIQVDNIDLTGSSSDMDLTVTAHTYFQPGKAVSILEQTVK
jgi:Tfp pilus assembly protein PilO